MIRHLLAALAFLIAALPAAHAQNAPSFNCAKAALAVEQMICADPALAAADRDLADTYNNISHQGGINAKKLRLEEDAWLANTRNKCTDKACIEAAYASRKAQLLDESQQAASPAAYVETRPFPAPAAALAIATAEIGKACGAIGFGGQPPPPFSTIPNFLIITLPGHYIMPLRIAGTRFAFALTSTPQGCTINDVVTLAPPDTADQFLLCAPADASLGLAPAGAGMRKSGSPTNIAYWDIDPATNRFIREPLSVLALDQSGLRCQQPETGD
jgi:uncharacterized protein